MAIWDLSHPIQSMSKARPAFAFFQNRAIANAAAAVERDRRAAALRATDDPTDLDEVMRRLAGGVA